uniref:Uncharacterized protein n=1 Tax=Medicago truncatula TaxID=3880 RepID=I3SIM6_MEDTR|nr:unknown [Medicago truncatula]
MYLSLPLFQLQLPKHQPNKNPSFHPKKLINQQNLRLHKPQMRLYFRTRHRISLPRLQSKYTKL